MTEAATKRERLREERRRQILDAALVVFARQGFHAANVSDVATQAGVSQGTIYWYFDSKEALLRHLVDEAFEEIIRPFAQMLAEESVPPLERVRRLFRASLDMSRGSSEQIRLVINLWSQPELFDPGTEATSLLTALYEEQILAPLTEVLEAGMATGEIAPGDARALAATTAALLDGLMLHSTIWPEGAVSDARLEATVLERFLQMAARTEDREHGPRSSLKEEPS